jgi:energy-coupling factor transporter ATP-binding protein EcfA2
MLIDSVHIRRFKSLTDVTVPLKRVTVLVGSNNAGKSSVLQAIQFGVSTVQSLALTAGPEKTSGTLAVDQLVYSPLRDASALAQGGQLMQSPLQQIEIGFNTDDGGARVSVRRGRNSNLAVAVSGDGGVLAALRDLKQPFSAFTPGLAGIPPIEEYRAPGVVRRAAAYGDANSVFRNVLWLLKKDATAWATFVTRMSRLFPDVTLELSYDEENDAIIRARVSRGGVNVPIDAAGTGILQAAQILSYIGVYRPKLLILDEPDSHLHPSNQRALIQLLGEVAEEDDFQVLISTHSRHLVDECIERGESILWMANGHLVPGDVGRLPILLSLGALDVGDRLRGGEIHTVVLTEDEKTKYIEHILSSSGRDLAKTQIWPYAGCTQLGAAKVLATFIDTMAPGCEVIVHRDRDYLSDDEVASLRQQYESRGLTLFVTKGVDIESHYLDVKHLAAAYPAQTESEIETLLEEATRLTEADSVRILANTRFTEAVNKWDRSSSRYPQAGDVTAAAQVEYSTDVARFRHGKQTLKEFSKLAEVRWGGSRNVVIDTETLRTSQLELPDEEA